MSASTIRNRDSLTPVSVPLEERAEAAALSRVLEDVGDAASSACEVVGPHGERFPIPAALLRILGRAAMALARGDAIAVVQVNQALTTQEAADLLNISRQYLVRLLDADEIPYQRTGTHRRLAVKDVLAFKEKRDQERQAALDELVSLSEDVNGYSELK
jgi:excisionase family DNA binding protein